MDNVFFGMHCTAFYEDRLIASGTLEQVARKIKESVSQETLSQILIFQDETSKQVEIDFRGSFPDVLKRLAEHPDAAESISTLEDKSPRRVGRPKLGVVPGEVTLLPRHWEWLKSQPGGASVTLRKIVDEARHAYEKKDAVRKAQEATYRFMATMAGNRPHYEEALRALYAGESIRFHELITEWAGDIRDHIKKLASNAFQKGEMKE